MKISLNVSELQEVIKKAQKVIAKGSKLPVLHSVKFSTLTGAITVTANNLEVVTVFTLSGSIMESGEMLLSNETLKLIAKLKNTYEIVISENLIQAGNKTLKFTSIDPEEFPITHDECTFTAFTISQPELIKAFSVNYASAIEDNRPVFNGVCIDQNTFLSTDTHRLAWYKAQIVNTLDKQIIIPLQTTKLLIGSLLDKKVSGFPVIVSVDKKCKYLKLEFQNTLVITRLIEGDFLNYKQVLPQDHKTNVKLNVKKLLDELSFIEELAKQSNGVITLAVEQNAIYFDAMAEGNAVTLNIESDITGELIECMAVSYKLLTDALKNVEGEEIEIKFNGAYSPISFNNSIVLPVRIKDMKRLNTAA